MSHPSAETDGPTRQRGDRWLLRVMNSDVRDSVIPARRSKRPSLVCRLHIFAGVWVSMKHQRLIVIGEENGWCVRLNGVDVVSFFGPHAQEWACREREELAQLLDAQSSGDPSDRHDRAQPFATPR